MLEVYLRRFVAAALMLVLASAGTVSAWPPAATSTHPGCSHPPVHCRMASVMSCCRTDKTPGPLPVSSAPLSRLDAPVAALLPAVAVTPQAPVLILHVDRPPRAPVHGFRSGDLPDLLSTYLI